MVLSEQNPEPKSWHQKWKNTTETSSHKDSQIPEVNYTLPYRTFEYLHMDRIWKKIYVNSTQLIIELQICKHMDYYFSDSPLDQHLPWYC